MAFGDLKVQDLIYEDGSNNEITVVLANLVVRDGSGDLVQADNKKFIAGTGSDLQIYHDGSNSFIKEAGTGSLFIDGTTVYIRNAAGDEHLANFHSNGTNNLYYDGVVKLSTNASGCTFGDNVKLQIGSSQDLQIYHNSIDNYIIGTTGDTYIRAADEVKLQSYVGSENMLVADYNGSVKLYYDNSKKLSTSGSGVEIENGDLRVHLDLKIINDNRRLWLGAGNDLSIYHDGSNSFLLNNTGNLYIQGDSSSTTEEILIRPKQGEQSARFIANGAVELYYDNSKKFETTSGGVNVTGALTINGAALAGGGFASVQYFTSSGHGLNHQELRL